MGELVARSGCAADLYRLVNRGLGQLPGRLAIATVGGNAIFGAVTGVSIASAATFSRVAYPEMIAHRYDRGDESIGRLFIAGVIPGIILSIFYGIFLLIYAIQKPEKFGGGTNQHAPAPLSQSEILGAIGVGCLIVLVLGGMWFGIFTPTEAAGIGPLLALVLALLKGLRYKDIAEAIWYTGSTSAPILILLIMAQLYSRLLAFGGIVDSIHGTLLGTGLGTAGILAIMILIWFILGCFIDSVSIILLTVPIFAPIAKTLGIDPIAFAIAGIVCIEAGLVTPPFGISVYTVKSSINDPTITLGEIFSASTPYWILLLVLAVLVLLFPSIATWLPNTMM